MNNRKNIYVLGMIAVATMAAPAASAQGVNLPDRFSYAAKFVCGTSFAPTTSPPKEPVVKRGNYATAVNIRNPWAQTALVTKQVFIAAPERYPQTTFIPPSRRVTDKLPPGSTMYVDCEEIVNLLQLGHIPIPGSFIDGFVVIDGYFPGTALVPDSPAELDVVTVTTTAAATVSSTGAAGGDVTSHEITPVQGRKLPKGTWPY